MLHLVKNIVHVEPYKLVLLLNTGEYKEIDIEKVFIRQATQPNNPLLKLLNKELFQQVQFDNEAETIYWSNLMTMRRKDGTTQPANLDFCPEVLYNESELLQKIQVFA